MGGGECVRAKMGNVQAGRYLERGGGSEGRREGGGWWLCEWVRCTEGRGRHGEMEAS